MTPRCTYCKKEIETRDSWEARKRKFCSHQCYSKSMVGYIPKSPPPHTPARYKLCTVCEKSFKLKRSSTKYCSRTCAGVAYSQKVRRTYCILCGKQKRIDAKKFCSTTCSGISNRGEKSATWKGGIRKDKDRRKSFEGVQWRKAVFARDDYTCQICRVKGGYLEADHIKAYATHVHLRYVVDNGRTLCKECHRKTPNYGSKARLDR